MSVLVIRAWTAGFVLTEKTGLPACAPRVGRAHSVRMVGALFDSSYLCSTDKHILAYEYQIFTESNLYAETTNVMEEPLS